MDQGLPKKPNSAAEPPRPMPLSDSPPGPVEKVEPPQPLPPLQGWRGVQYPNPPDPVNPDVATLKDQWRFAIRQYSRWYSHAWGTAILAGAAFFALGWFVKGSNPLPSRSTDDRADVKSPPP